MNYKDFCGISKTIYDELSDDISKRVFSNRILYNLTGNYTYLRNIFREWKWESRLVSDLKAFNKGVYIYGAGDFGRRLVNFFPEIRWSAFVDRNYKNIDNLPLPVIHPDEFAKQLLDAPIIISVKKGYDEIRDYLKSIGINDHNIFILSYYLSEMSNIYFDLDQLVPQKDEVFADLGVFDGKSTSDFIEWAGNDYKASYMFEPNVEMQPIILNRVKSMRNCRLVPFGVWDKNTRLGFVLSGANKDGSYVVEEQRDDAETIEVVSLDSFFEKEGIHPTYIKMDVEGAEMKALIGAENIIKKYKPKLAVSIYHRLEDLWEIPDIIMKYRPDYDLYIRHYTMAAGDTVLYAL